jgi:DNA mismatch endonuclease, patch repair protein
MSRIGSENTTTELAVRRLVFAMGYRYRLHDKSLPGKPDLVFRGRSRVIFVNGCFWHGHLRCKYARLPKSRIEFWSEKIEANRTRDKRKLAWLRTHGWRVLTIWQCELKNVDRLTKKIHKFFTDE